VLKNSSLKKQPSAQNSLKREKSFHSGRDRGHTKKQE